MATASIGHFDDTFQTFDIIGIAIHAHGDGGNNVQ